MSTGDPHLSTDPGRVLDPDLLRQVEEWTAWVAAETTRRLAESVGDSESESGPAHRRRAERTVAQILDQAASDALAAGRPVLEQATEALITRRVLAQVSGLGPLQQLLDDPEIENINCNGTRVWVRYADGRREQRPPIFSSPGELVALVRRIAAESTTGERRFDPGAPILDMPLPGGERMNAIMEVAREPAVSIRRHRHSRTTLERLRELGTLDDTLVELLRAAVRSRRNMVITGGTGAGKTTLLRAIAADIPPTERIVTIEDVFELGFDQDREAHPDCVALQARPANIEGVGEITIADLVRTALRMSPDRVIVGETRGHETVPLLNAMSQGNDGSLTTLHASDSAGAFTKFAAYAAQSAERLPLEATAALVASAVHLVVHVSASPAGGRRVTSVREVVGAEDRRVVSNEIYRRSPDGRVLAAAPPGPETIDALVEAGFDIALLRGETDLSGWSV
ncbi:CpaF family protein [Marinitenerispora sediminis]|uniref:Type II secretion system protein E n=1 Tax=Marinitenerispora sediminis TaxID=1931232 RepID=A0A368T2R2_9ACTN|nr:ATPase, T2SS/T4P/T4SS family [Marinitenerispora sediminis]RCV47466.1 type II secretion system protein E [Marinitenerispora sediminis]RCV56192.1 type II secretion system protein E [Marinitenerispora sediminis]RCV57481.1 type II secretion system protein E [Marinitenerispora sediminis]